MPRTVKVPCARTTTRRLASPAAPKVCTSEYEPSPRTTANLWIVCHSSLLVAPSRWSITSAPASAGLAVPGLTVPANVTRFLIPVLICAPSAGEVSGAARAETGGVEAAVGHDRGRHDRV